MAAPRSLPSTFRPIPASVEVLYQTMVELGGGVYRGFCRASEDHPDLIVFEDGNPSHRNFMMALPALHITADAVRSAIRRQAGAE